MSTYGDLPHVPHAPHGSGPSPDESAQALRHLQNLSVTRRIVGHRPLTEEEQTELAEEKPCIHCGGFHARSCPRVKRIAFHPNGQIAEAEYWLDADVDWSGVVFEDVGGGDETRVPSVDIETVVCALSEPVGGMDVWPLEVRAAAARVTAWLEGAES